MLASCWAALLVLKSSRVFWSSWGKGLDVIESLDVKFSQADLLLLLTLKFKFLVARARVEAEICSFLPARFKSSRFSSPTVFSAWGFLFLFKGWPSSMVSLSSLKIGSWWWEPWRDWNAGAASNLILPPEMLIRGEVEVMMASLMEGVVWSSTRLVVTYWLISSLQMNIAWEALSRTSAEKFVPKPVGMEVVSGRRALGSLTVLRQWRHASDIWLTMFWSPVVKK